MHLHVGVEAPERVGPGATAGGQGAGGAVEGREAVRGGDGVFDREAGDEGGVGGGGLDEGVGGVFVAHVTEEDGDVAGAHAGAETAAVEGGEEGGADEDAVADGAEGVCGDVAEGGEEGVRGEGAEPGEFVGAWEGEGDGEGGEEGVEVRLEFGERFGREPGAVGPEHDAPDEGAGWRLLEVVGELVEGGVGAGGEAAEGDVVLVAGEAGDVGGRPFERGALVPEAEVAVGAARQARFLLQLVGGQEAEDVEPVGGRDDDAADGGLGEELGRVFAVRRAPLEEAAVWVGRS